MKIKEFKIEDFFKSKIPIYLFIFNKRENFLFKTDQKIVPN